MVSGTKGLIVYKNKILLILRDNKPDITYPNTWEYVGGGKEEWESFEQAGLREIQEEIGITPENFTFLGLDKYPDGIAGRFISIINDDEYKKIKLGEGKKFNFFTLDEATKLVMAPGIKRFLVTNLDVLKEIIDEGKEVNKNNFVFSDTRKITT